MARRLVERGARVDRLWHAAAPGILSRLDELLATDPPPTAEDINNAFWQARHGAQRRAAELLLGRGADVNWIPDYAETGAEPGPIRSTAWTIPGRGAFPVNSPGLGRMS